MSQPDAEDGRERDDHHPGHTGGHQASAALAPRPFANAFFDPLENVSIRRAAVGAQLRGERL